MNNEKEIIETEVEEKETLEGEVVEEVFDDNSSTFDPNVILNTIMQSQDAELRGVELCRPVEHLKELARS